MILLGREVKINIARAAEGIFLSFVFLFLIGISFFIINWFFVENKLFENYFFQKNLKASVSNIQTDSQIKAIKRQQEILDLDAKSIFSLEVGFEQENILFKKNENEKLPIASLVKLMTVLLVLEKYDLSEKVTISQEAMAQEGEQGVLKLGETLSVKNLLYITLIESGNRAAKALSEVMGTDKFVALMNNRAKNLGLLNSYFRDPTGLDSENYSTAKDLFKLSKYLFENYSLFREIVGLKEFDLYLDDDQFHHKLTNTNKLLGEVESVVGGKTGWTDIAKGCVMAIQESKDKKNYIIHIILGSEDRFKEAKKLISFVN